MERIIPHELEKPDCDYLSIARGWFALGNYSKAMKALNQIIPELQQHPEVSKLRAQIEKALTK
jgi:hypothetical protein